MPRVSAPTPEIIREAAELLRAGGVVAFPTETVYGLGADTFNAAAIDHIYRIKGRPFDNPLIAHVLDVAQAQRVLAKWDDRCEKLARRFWPGPLTLVGERAPDVPAQATAGYPTIAARSPAHPVARDLLAAFDSPISAPSANRSGHVSPTRAEHVAADFAAEADLLILDGGPCAIGIESTVLDLSTPTPRVLRPGSVTREELEAALGAPVEAKAVSSQLAAPGSSPAHYAPHTPAELVSSWELPSRLAASHERYAVLARSDLVAPPSHLLISMPRDAERYAAELYEALRRADSSGSERILIESPEDEGSGLWSAIMDRLRRATLR